MIIPRKTKRASGKSREAHNLKFQKKCSCPLLVTVFVTIQQLNYNCSQSITYSYPYRQLTLEYCNSVLSQCVCTLQIEFSRNYTKLAMLSFFVLFRSEG